MVDLIEKVVGVAVGLFVAAVILPPALTMLANDTALSGVDASVVTILQVLLPIVAVVGIAMYFIKKG